MDKPKMYGIWNNRKKEFQFGIKEPSKRKAWHRLFEKIGNDARKWRFEVKVISEQALKQMGE
jgi:hypothetical protein